MSSHLQLPEVLLEAAQLQTLLQLDHVMAPVLVEAPLRLLHLNQESEIITSIINVHLVLLLLRVVTNRNCLGTVTEGARGLV